MRALCLVFGPITKHSSPCLSPCSPTPKASLCHCYPQLIKPKKVVLLEEDFLTFCLLSVELLYNHDINWVYSEVGRGRMFVQQEAELSLLRVGRRWLVIQVCVHSPMAMHLPATEVCSLLVWSDLLRAQRSKQLHPSAVTRACMAPTTGPCYFKPSVTTNIYHFCTCLSKRQFQ